MRLTLQIFPIRRLFYKLRRIAIQVRGPHPRELALTVGLIVRQLEACKNYSSIFLSKFLMNVVAL